MSLRRWYGMAGKSSADPLHRNMLAIRIFLNDPNFVNRGAFAGTIHDTNLIS
jgi:hypothetical protein